MPRNMRSFAVAVVLAVLAASPANAQPFGAVRSEGQTDFLSLTWEWLASLIEPEESQDGPGKGPMEKEGSQMDPNGLD